MARTVRRRAERQVHRAHKHARPRCRRIQLQQPSGSADLDAARSSAATSLTAAACLHARARASACVRVRVRARACVHICACVLAQVSDEGTSFAAGSAAPSAPPATHVSPSANGRAARFAVTTTGGSGACGGGSGLAAPRLTSAVSVRLYLRSRPAWGEESAGLSYARARGDVRGCVLVARASSSACGDQLLSHKGMRGVGPEDSRRDPSGRGLSGRGLSGRGLSRRGPKPMKRESRAEGSEWDAHK